MVADAIGDMVRWQVEQDAPLPMAESRIAMMETRGVIVDLCGGGSFVPRDSWTDFAVRWVVEMQRRDVVATDQSLGWAIWWACGGQWSPTFCNAVAYKTLPDAERKVCTVLTA